MEENKLYQENGWVNWDYIYNLPQHMIFVTGGRGIGKTYGLIKYLIEHKKKFIFVRRTQIEADIQMNMDVSDLTPVLEDLGINAKIETIPKTPVSIVSNIDSGEKIALIGSLRTFGKIRGMNFREYEAIVFDEFIPKPEEPKFKLEGFALKQAYESVNRNRELEGRDAVKMICLSNSLNMQNDTFMEFNLIGVAENLARSKNEIYSQGEVAVIIHKYSPISEKKSGTVLYKDAQDDFYKMAIKNEFILNDFTYIGKQNLKEYQCKAQIGDLFVYKHKSKPIYYIAETKGQTKNIILATASGKEKIKRKYWRLWIHYLDGDIMFDSYKSISLFERYFE